jgi:hypothetical protein
MTDAPKKRPWLQFHLSTAIIMMFVAAGLLWVNMHAVPQRRDTGGGYMQHFGWPMTMASQERYYTLDAVGLVNGRLNIGGLDSIVVNAIVALFILVATAVVCEWFIRRRERQHD